MRNIFNNIKLYSKAMLDGIYRLIPLLAILGFLVYRYELTDAVGVSLIIPIFAGIVSHLLRKLLFPYIDLKQLILEVKKENSIASALIVLAIILFMTVMTAILGFAIIR